MVTRITSFALQGVDAYPVVVEVDVQNGLPQFEVVGLPDAAVRESRERVRAAIRNSGLEFPPQRITVNLAPGDVRKAGPGFDLPIALAVLAATEQIPAATDGVPDLSTLGVVGELALDGAVRPVSGALAMAQAAVVAGLRGLLLPVADAPEAALARGPAVWPAAGLDRVGAWLRGRVTLAPAPFPSLESLSGPPEGEDLADVYGQPMARRALEVAAAGGHNLLLLGPPGVGKSMLARRLPGILPPLAWDEAVEVTKIYSAAGERPPGGLVTRRPCRQPHHSVSRSALVGTLQRPGELALAHHGVLFIDELLECGRDALEALRQPLEEGRVYLSRAAGQISYPARVMLVAAANPCPCGKYGTPGGGCKCAQPQLQRYAARLSGPILDRFDLQVRLQPVEFATLKGPPGESSLVVAQRVAAARLRQRQRLGTVGRARSNASMDPGQVRRFCTLAAEAEGILHRAFTHYGLSVRGWERILKVARTIADLAGAEAIAPEHVGEAIQYRLNAGTPGWGGVPAAR